MTIVSNDNLYMTGQQMIEKGIYRGGSRIDPDFIKDIQNGKFTIWDPDKDRYCIPTSQLKKLRRIFNKPTRFVVNGSNWERRSSIGCFQFEFKKPEDSKLEFLRIQAENVQCWQSSSVLKIRELWCFDIPNELCDFSYLKKNQLVPGERIELIITKHYAECKEGILPLKELSDSDKEKYNYTSIEVKASLWYEIKDEFNNVAWHYRHRGGYSRSFDPHRYTIEEVELSTLRSEFGDKAYSFHDSGVEGIRFQEEKTPEGINDLYLSMCKGERHKFNDEYGYKFNDENAALRSVTNGPNKSSGDVIWYKADYANWIMDTMYIYVPYTELSRKEYYTISFDIDEFITRDHYLSPAEGKVAFKNHVLALSYRRETHVDADQPNETTATSAKPPSVDQLVLESSQKPHKNKSISDKVGIKPDDLLLLSIRRTNKSDKTEQELKKEKEARKKEEHVRILIIDLRRDIFTLLFCDNCSKSLLYNEIRNKGFSQIDAARMLYWDKLAAERYKVKNIIDSQDLEGHCHKTAANNDKILKFSVNTLKGFYKDLESEYNEKGKIIYANGEYEGKQYIPKLRLGPSKRKTQVAPAKNK